MKHANSRIFILPVLCLLATACGRGGTPALDVETFNLQHRSGLEAAELIAPYVFTDRTEAPGQVASTPEGLTVRETRDNLERIGRVLEEFDRPYPSVRLRFQLIEADSFRDEDPAISEVVDELRELFRFEGYRLLGEAVVAVGGGRSRFQQPFFGAGGDLPERYIVEGEAVSRNQGAVRLDEIRLWSENGGSVLGTSVNVVHNQTLVMGGSVEYQSGRNLILTVKAEID